MNYQRILVPASGGTATFDPAKGAAGVIISAEGGAVTLTSNFTLSLEAGVSYPDSFDVILTGGITLDGNTFTSFGSRVDGTSLLYGADLKMAYDPESESVSLVAGQEDSTSVPYVVNIQDLVASGGSKTLDYYDVGKDVIIEASGEMGGDIAIAVAASPRPPKGAKITVFYKGELVLGLNEIKLFGSVISGRRAFNGGFYIILLWDERFSSWLVFDPSVTDNSALPGVIVKKDANSDYAALEFNQRKDNAIAYSSETEQVEAGFIALRERVIELNPSQISGAISTPVIAVLKSNDSSKAIRVVYMDFEMYNVTSPYAGTGDIVLEYDGAGFIYTKASKVLASSVDRIASYVPNFPITSDATKTQILRNKNLNLKIDGTATGGDGSLRVRVLYYYA